MEHQQADLFATLEPEQPPAPACRPGWQAVERPTGTTHYHPQRQVFLDYFPPVAAGERGIWIGYQVKGAVPPWRLPWEVDNQRIRPEPFTTLSEAQAWAEEHCTPK